MADHGVAHAKRAARRADTVEQFRNVRQRIDDIETRLDATAARVDQHELRLGYMEACLKIVLRGFTCVQEFLRNKDTDYKLAKGAFIAAFLRNSRIPAQPRPIGQSMRLRILLLSTKALSS